MYYLTYFLGLFLASINERKNIFFSFFFIILLLLAVFRFGVGSDYFSYKYLFQRLHPNPLTEILTGLDGQELGFRILGAFFKGIGMPFELYLAVFAIINLIYVYKLCKHYSKNPTMSLVLYFAFYYFVWTFSGIRQGLVLSVGVYYLVKYCIGKFSWKYIFIVLALTLIHSSAVLLIVLYIMSRINFTKNHLLAIFCISLFVSFLPLNMIFRPLENFPIVNRIIPYLPSEYSILNVVDFQSFVRIIFVIIVFIYYEAYSKRSDLDKKILNVYILSMSIYFIFKFSELTAARLSIYGKYLDVLIFVNIYFLYKQKINKFIYICLLVAMATLYLVKELSAFKAVTSIEFEENRIIVPYTSIFEKDEIPLKELPFNLEE